MALDPILQEATTTLLESPPGWTPADGLGTAAAATMIVYTCLGLPMQVLANARRRSTHGLSLPMFALSCLAFALFTAYGLARDPIDWYLVASNIPGTLLTGTILLQFWVFRGSDPDPTGR